VLWILGEPTLTITDAADAEAAVVGLLAGREAEALAAVALDRRHRVIDTEILTTGNDSMTVVCPRQILRWVLTRARPATSVLVAHNHPSGASQPSSQDDDVTWRLGAACRAAGITFVDHLIIGSAVYSYATSNPAALSGR